MKVLLVEDNEADVRLIREMVRDAGVSGFDLSVAGTIGEALSFLDGNGCDAVLLDLGLPDSQGLEGLTRLAQARPALPVVILTGLDDQDTGLHAVQAGGQDYLVKGKVTPELLVRSVRYAVERRAFEKARTELDRRTAEFKTLVEQASDGIFVADAEGNPLETNQALCQMLGYDRDEFLGLKMTDLLSVEELAARPLDLEALRSGQPILTERKVRRKDGAQIPVEISTRILPDGRAQGIVRDISERRRLEGQLREVQKMEAVGRLAGGIAHDFNNLLTVVTGYCALLLDSLDQDDPVRGEVEEISKAGKRGQKLTRQLLAFGRRQVLKPEVIDPNEVMRSVERMLRRVIGEDVRLTARTTDPAWLVKADMSQLEQVLLNLALNARDAMPAGGRLTLTTENLVLGEENLSAFANLAPGEYVQLCVSDTGCGMSEEIKSRAFEPFFTTKPKGKGTGLGLSTAYGIVRQSGGDMACDTEPGEGTVFRILLPRCEAETPTKRYPVLSESGLAGSETVLLVEDQEEVRVLCQRALQMYGYNVLAARTGAEALVTARRHRGPIHLVLSDVVMPGMSGPDLVEKLGKVRPGMARLFISGYGFDELARQGVLDEEVPLLGKPFAPRDLAEAVRSAMAGTRGN